MKRYMLYAGIIILAICSFLLGKNIIPLFNHGITVKYQRVTGPEFIVLEGENTLRKAVKPDRDDISYSELYIKNNSELDTDYGAINAETYVIRGNYERVSDDGYVIINMTNILSKTAYTMKGILFLVTSASLLLLVFIALRNLLN